MARAPKPEPTKAVASYSDRLAALAKKAVATEAAVGSTSAINLKGGILSVGGIPVPDNKMNVIVVDHVGENAFYGDEPYDPSNPQSPVCFSFWTGETDQAPHEKSEEPQCESCLGCPQNQFGSARQGRGKACKNIRRLGLITEDGMEYISSATIYTLKVPVMSVKNWAAYTKKLDSTLGLPPLGVITEIHVVPDPVSQFRIEFRLVEKIEDEGVLEALLDRQEQVASDLAMPYTPNSERTAPLPQARGRAAAAAPRGRAPAPTVNKASPKLGGRR